MGCGTMRPNPTQRPSAVAVAISAALATPTAAVVSLVSAVLMVALAWSAVNWAVIQAVPPWSTGEACRGAQGACWPFLVEKNGFILFGTYPYDERWRPVLASILLCVLSVLAGFQALGKVRFLSVRGSVVCWLITLGAAYVLMAGGSFGLEPVDSNKWNGLPVLLILSVVAMAIAFPIAIGLALGRHQQTYPLLRSAAAIYVETMRGVPMVTVLFVGIFVLPLMLPPGSSISPMFATLVALILFHTAYFAEDVRSGLQAVPAPQREAADALGLRYREAMGLVVLPQAINRCLPGLMNSIIGAYKDTSLVVVVGIHDLTATARMAFNDPSWREFALEAYLFVGLWFFVSCAFLSEIGRRLHARASARQR